VVVVAEVMEVMETDPDPPEENVVAEVIADHRCPIVDDTLEAEMHLKVQIALAFLD